MTIQQLNNIQNKQHSKRYLLSKSYNYLIGFNPYIYIIYTYIYIYHIPHKYSFKHDSGIGSSREAPLDQSSSTVPDDFTQVTREKKA